MRIEPSTSEVTGACSVECASETPHRTTFQAKFFNCINKHYSCRNFRCDFLLPMEVNEWISYKYSDEGLYTQNIHNSSTRSHVSEEENYCIRNCGKIASVNRSLYVIIVYMEATK